MTIREIVEDRLAGQTYTQYLATMRAYNFSPMDLSAWQSWQVHYDTDLGKAKP